MNKFLELSFRNHIRNNEKIADEFYSKLEPILDEMRKYLSEDIACEIENLFLDLASDALEIAGVAGMELAIGVIEGTINQVIE